MESNEVVLTSRSIQHILKSYNPEKAISEYIWNGFDANATEVDINIKYANNEFGFVESMEIIDNGDGICYEELPEKFKVFYDSTKRKEKKSKSDLIHGKNGYGRLTFFKFARFASWHTRYLFKDTMYEYDIDINSDNLKSYQKSEKQLSNSNTSGTVVSFKDINKDISLTYENEKLIPYLQIRFAWFLEVKKDAKILINGEELNYRSVIGDREDVKFEVFDSDHTKHTFHGVYINWNKKSADEYSNFYFLNNDYKIKYKKTTKLNKKGDNFYHSLIIVDDFFNEITVSEMSDEESGNKNMFDSEKNRLLFKELEKELNDFLAGKRRPFLKRQANSVIKDFEKENVMPNFGSNSWDLLRKQSFVDFVKELYEVRPSVFMKLNIDQKRIFLELLNLVMDTKERDNLFSILDSVIDLSTDDRAKFAKLLETTRLKQVVSTINLIKDRIMVVEDLKKVLFDHGLKAGEVKHLQQIIVNHYWIFGEEYNLVCAEEVKFTQALEKYRYLLLGIDKKEYIEHPDKYKEMDLFLTGKDFQYNSPKNLVVEIKNPTNIRKLTYKEFDQIQHYEDVIIHTDAFNDNRESWNFILVGQDIDDHLYSMLKNKKTGLASMNERSRIYVKRWSEIINDIEFRHKYLLDKLKIEREHLSNAENLPALMNELQNNDAAMS